jgi:hypothetical protein
MPGSVIRVQAHREEGSEALHLGPEFPIENELAFIELIQTLCSVYREGRSRNGGHI